MQYWESESATAQALLPVVMAQGLLGVVAPSTKYVPLLQSAAVTSRRSGWLLKAAAAVFSSLLSTAEEPKLFTPRARRKSNNLLNVLPHELEVVKRFSGLLQNCHNEQLQSCEKEAEKSPFEVTKRGLSKV
jgi:hypothetical protein